MQSKCEKMSPLPQFFISQNKHTVDFLRHNRFGHFFFFFFFLLLLLFVKKPLVPFVLRRSTLIYCVGRGRAKPFYFGCVYLGSETTQSSKSQTMFDVRPKRIDELPSDRNENVTATNSIFVTSDFLLINSISWIPRLNVLINVHLVFGRRGRRVRSRSLINSTHGFILLSFTFGGPATAVHK